MHYPYSRVILYGTASLKLLPGPEIKDKRILVLGITAIILLYARSLVGI